MFESSEKEFQFCKLIHHDKVSEAEALLDLESTIEIKQEAKKAIPEIHALWLKINEQVMSEICRKKFKACIHVRNALMESRSEIAEATIDKQWGTGFDIDHMLECLPDF